MKLRHPNSKQTVETNNPGVYLSQGWLEVKAAKPKASESDS